MVALKLDGGDRKAWLMTAAATGMTLLNRSLIGNGDDLHSSSLCRQTRELAWWRVQTKDVARLCVVAGLVSVFFTCQNRLSFFASHLKLVFRTSCRGFELR
jgi:hypothetical protein